MAVATMIFTAVALCARAQSARTAPVATSPIITISGRVVADATGDPIPNARVTFSPSAQGTPVVLTDGDGRFTLTALPGTSIVVASKSGYGRAEVTLANGQPVNFRLRRGAVISGRVVDEFGDPVPAILVTGEASSTSATNPTIVATADTDDRGEYRLASLPAGSFAVAVRTIGAAIQRVVGNNQVAFFPDIQKTYYPGVASPADAQFLRLQSGEDRSGIDFVVPAERAELPPVVTTRAAMGLAPAQNATARPTGIIRGRVVGTDGRAIAHAPIRLLGQTDIMQSQVGITDSDGRFEFRERAAGRFRVTAAKKGYSPIEAAECVQSTSLPLMGSGRSVDLADGETRERVDFSLARCGSLTGQVFDELGDPLQGASVQLLQIRYEAGRRRLVASGAEARVTDDLGRYRLYNLVPGQYIVSATVGAVSSADVPGYTRSYFPGTTSPAEAQFVSMGTSQDVAGIDVSMARTRTARVAGQVLNAAGEGTMAGLMLLPSQRSASVTSVAVGARISDDGTFEFPNVPPGQYVIQASRGTPSSWTESEFAAMPVSVDGTDVQDLVLQTSAGSSIGGRFTFDVFDNSNRPTPSAIELKPIPVDLDLSLSRPATANIHADWTFEMAGINGPRRLQLIRTPAGWTLKEIRVSGIDVTDRPLSFGRTEQSLTDVEVVLTDRISEVSGTIADTNDRPAPGSRVVVFSTDRSQWYPASRFLRSTVAGPDAAFTLTGLPFGTYYAAAAAQLPVEGEDSWQDLQFLDALVSRASTVTIGDGQKQFLTLRLPTR